MREKPSYASKQGAHVLRGDIIAADFFRHRYLPKEFNPQTQAAMQAWGLRLDETEGFPGSSKYYYPNALRRGWRLIVTGTSNDGHITHASLRDPQEGTRAECQYGIDRDDQFVAYTKALPRYGKVHRVGANGESIYDVYDNAGNNVVIGGLDLETCKMRIGQLNPRQVPSVEHRLTHDHLLAGWPPLRYTARDRFLDTLKL